MDAGRFRLGAALQRRRRVPAARPATSAKVLNIPDYRYFRRIRQNSLTTAHGDGAEVARAPARDGDAVGPRAPQRRARRGRARQPDLAPCRTAPPSACGGSPGRRCGARASRRGAPAARRAGARPRPARRGPPRPVFVIGADRSGASALAWALGQHPSLPAVDRHRLGGRARRPSCRGSTSARSPDSDRARPLGAERFSRTFGRAAARARSATSSTAGSTARPSTRCQRARAGQAVPGGALRPRRARRRRRRALARRPAARLRRRRPAARRSRRTCACAWRARGSSSAG